MKKLIILLLACSCTFILYAQETTDTTMAGKTKIKTDDSKTKIKEGKSKTKDADGKMKVKDKDDMNSDGSETKIKEKDGKLKMKDDDGKVKIKSDGNMNTTTSGTMKNSGMGTTNTSTNTNVVIINGWRTDPANLPVVGNNIAPEVVTTLKNKYGATIYDIKKILSTSGQDIYVVRIMENGGTRTEYVGADGNIVSQ